jgi:hypothetical protein
MWRVISQRSHPDIQATDKHLDEILNLLMQQHWFKGLRNQTAYCIDVLENFLFWA